ncbi:L,D-transpeptidase family protein [Propionibacterium freudenreichii]|uniref:L,D-transpeptidase n=1 Tax=Propionibacterium freudenreichii TaxID=1744 RepID=UPI0009BBCB70|nr:Ig-like domain-containing protein [Propionibacterium freudenreichii]MCT3000578.1 L,D-transpeptidase [Propionibacterium freudenreichii]MDK9302106.1 L,D-transpeptidase family protein [Propionibacterium freudenreichii]MDK9318887.1 L,D-transpeptidase family protein [Propionibacterium freudenreichii]MDK9322376.1 L,D-transpeptidase family protein [Propionibacterium freudenreichii]MDK9323399.1 L,D-transpeptidase family protein [Propionibacterium freudenreichii]
MPRRLHPTSRFSRRGALAAVAVGAGAVGLAACSKARPGSTGASASSKGPATPTLSLTAPHGLDAVLPQDALTVAVNDGTLKSIVVADSNGNAYSGQLNGSTWTCDRAFWPAASYNVTVEATDAKDGPHTLTASFTTAKVETIVYSPVYVQQGLGVGMPVYIQFNSPITDKAIRADIERHATVTTAPVQEGSWGWVENRILMWRPKNYWLAGSTAKVSLAFAGLVVGDGLYLADDTNYSISFGEAHVLRCNNSSQYMGVYQNDNLVKNLPVSTGTAAHPTLSGTKVIMEKLTSMIMDSSTYGVPATSAEGYKLKVDSCQRVTWSGEFIHAAPWSVAQQGNTPSSHGCVNVSPTEAAWLMSFTQVGDPVEFTGGGPSFQPGDGVGCWVYDWDSWQQRSALV